MEIDKEYDSEGYIQSIHYIRNYQQLIIEETDELLTKLSNKKFRTKLVDLMFNEKIHKYRQSIDCKMFELFINSNIDWTTFVELTYSNCKL